MSSSPRIGSLCTGYGGLDLAVMEVFGGSMVWHCQYEPPDKDGREDKHQYAARVLAHHWPDVPNHGDLTAVDWSRVEPVDIITAGFPCTDISLAGLGAGITEGTRSGLWFTIARAIGALRPRLVVLENVRAIVSRRPGLDVVLAELARLRFDAVWTCVRASDVGAPHQRWRWFLLAWPADAQGPRLQGTWLRGRVAGDGRDVVADAYRVGHQWDRTAGQSAERHTEGAGGLAADAAGVGEREPSDQTLAVAGGVEARPMPGGRDGVALAYPEGDGRREGWAQPARIVGGLDASLGGSPASSNAESERHGNTGTASERGVPAAAVPGATTYADGDTVREQPVSEFGGVGAPIAGLPRVEWGPYGPAVRRWERVFGRTAPRPIDDRGRLSPAFVEWMMGLPLGWVSEVPPAPGMSAAGLRNARLKALGNGVVPQQAAHALRVLLARAFGEVAA